MIKLVPLTEELMLELLGSPGLERVGDSIRAEHIPPLLTQKHSYAFINVYGEVIAAAGLIQWWEERAEGWAIFSKDAGKYFVAIHKIVTRFLKAGTNKRIEATVELNFPRGKRWIELLGFKLEAPCLAQYREGQDYALYSYIHLPGLIKG